MKKLLKQNRGVALEMAIATLAIAAAACLIVVTCTAINAHSYRSNDERLETSSAMNAIAEDYVYALTTGDIKTFNKKYSDIFKTAVADQIRENDKLWSDINKLPESTKKQKEVKQQRLDSFEKYVIPEYTIEIEDDHQIVSHTDDTDPANPKEIIDSDKVISQTLHIYKGNSDSSSLNVTVTLTTESGANRTVKYWK